MAVTMFSMAWSPLAVKTYYDSPDDYSFFYRQMLIYVLAVFGFMAMTLTMLAPVILWVLAPKEYAPALVAVGPLSPFRGGVSRQPNHHLGADSEAQANILASVGRLCGGAEYSPVLITHSPLGHNWRGLVHRSGAGLIDHSWWSGDRAAAGAFPL